MKAKMIFTLLIALFLFSGSTIHGGKEKFTGESFFQPCSLDIPLYYSTKKQADLKRATEEYKGVELVLVTTGKKGKATYTFYYLKGYEGSYGSSAYLVKSEDMNSERPKQLFLKYKPRKHSFYRADCFREILTAHPELEASLKEKG